MCNCSSRSICMYMCVFENCFPKYITKSCKIHKTDSIGKCDQNCTQYLALILVRLID